MLGDVSFLLGKSDECKSSLRLSPNVAVIGTPLPKKKPVQQKRKARAKPVAVAVASSNIPAATVEGEAADNGATAPAIAAHTHDATDTDDEVELANSNTPVALTARKTNPVATPQKQDMEIETAAQTTRASEETSSGHPKTIAEARKKLNLGGGAACSITQA